MRNLLRLTFYLIVLSAGFFQRASGQELPLAKRPTMQYPAKSEELVVISGKDKIYGLSYLAEGEGPHPTALFLNGFPGFERNLDIAQELRANGWNTVSFNYRGSWGSGGLFTYEHCIEDVNSIIRFLKNSQNKSRLRVDSSRLILIASSFGGGVAMNYIQQFPDEVNEVILLSSFNMGGFGRYIQETGQIDDYRAYLSEKGQINFVSTQSYVSNLLENQKRFDYQKDCSVFTNKSILIVDENDKHADFTRCLQSNGQKLKYVMLGTDHNFSSHRKELIILILDWLSSN